MVPGVLVRRVERGGPHGQGQGGRQSRKVFLPRAALRIGLPVGPGQKKA